MSVHVIAEAGSNYNGSVALAKQLNAVAANARADSVKYQIINTDDLYRKGEYAYGHYKIEDIRAVVEAELGSGVGPFPADDHPHPVGPACQVE